MQPQCPVTREQDPKILKLLHLGQWLVPDPKWRLQPFLCENHGLRLGGVNSHSGRTRQWNSSPASWRQPPDQDNKTTSPTKSRGEILIHQSVSLPSLSAVHKYLQFNVMQDKFFVFHLWPELLWRSCGLYVGVIFYTLLAAVNKRWLVHPIALFLSPPNQSWHMSASPWAWLSHQPLHVKSKFFLPAIAKCLLTRITGSLDFEL